MKIGQSIKQLRKRQDLTQGELAKIIGITQTYLSQIEASKRTPNTSILIEISKYFKVPLPIIFWFSIEETDIKKEKIPAFRTLKPTIDQMINTIF